MTWQRAVRALFFLQLGVRHHRLGLVGLRLLRSVRVVVHVGVGLGVEGLLDGRLLGVEGGLALAYR